jgi:hypothetical protein
MKALKGRANPRRNRGLGLERPFRASWNEVAYPRALPWTKVGSPLRGFGWRRPLKRQRRDLTLAQGNARGLYANEMKALKGRTNPRRNRGWDWNALSGLPGMGSGFALTSDIRSISALNPSYGCYWSRPGRARSVTLCAVSQPEPGRRAAALHRRRHSVRGAHRGTSRRQRARVRAYIPWSDGAGGHACPPDHDRATHRDQGRGSLCCVPGPRSSRCVLAMAATPMLPPRSGRRRPRHWLISGLGG